eukprot:25614-Pelagococcus_subviridis.AAC.2
MRREKSLRIGVHHANAVVREPVYGTHLRDRPGERGPAAAADVEEVLVPRRVLLVRALEDVRAHELAVFRALLRAGVLAPVEKRGVHEVGV